MSQGDYLSGNNFQIHIIPSLSSQFSHRKLESISEALNFDCLLCQIFEGVLAQLPSLALDEGGKAFKEHFPVIHLDSSGKWNQLFRVLRSTVSALHREAKASTLLLQPVAPTNTAENVPRVLALDLDVFELVFLQPFPFAEAFDAYWEVMFFSLYNFAFHLSVFHEFVCKQ